MPQKSNPSADREKILKRLEYIKIASLVGLSMLFIALGILFLSHPGLRNFERRITWSFLFNFRDSAGQSPVLDPRLRVLSFDQSSEELLNRSTMNVKEWSHLLSFLDRHRPASIYLDRSLGWSGNDASALSDVLPSLEALNSRVVLSARMSTNPRQGPHKLDLSASQFQARGILPDMLSDLSDDDLQKLLSASKFKERPAVSLQEPSHPFQSMFNLGHLESQNENEIFPIFKIGRLQIFPSLALSGRINLKVDSEGMSAFGKPIPIKQDGALLVNWLSPEKLSGQTFNIASAFDAMGRSELWEALPENSHIFILPRAIDEDSEMTASPYGAMPDGYRQIVTLNSALTSTWLSDYTSTSLLIVLIILSILMTRLSSNKKLFVLLAAVSGCIVGVGILGFVLLSVDTPWLVYSSFMFCSGISFRWLNRYWDQQLIQQIQKNDDEAARKRKEERRLAKEKADADRIAAIIKPESLPEWPGILMSSFNKGKSPISGNWYLFEKSASGRFGHLIMCDVIGDGLQAALVVNCCKILISTLRNEKNKVFENENFIVEYAKRLNSILFSQGQGQLGTSLVGLTFDFDKEEICFLSCAHPFPLHHSKEYGKSWKTLKGQLSDPLGSTAELSIELKRKNISVGDIIIVHSNGVGLSQNRRILRRYFEEMDSGILIPAKRLFEASRKEVLKAKGEVQQDDASLVVFVKQK